jgi:2-phosphosulfolactate phosphatase
MSSAILSSLATVRVHVAFTPDEAAEAPTGIVIDVLRATSTIAQALAAGYERVLCVAEIEQARTLRAEIAESIVGGERDAIRIEGFDVGASPREFLEPRARTLILSTTNGTRTIVTAAERCNEVLLGSLLNLEAVVAAARERGEDVAILCAGYKGAFALDDAYCAGRIVQLLDGERTDAAVAADVIASAYPSALDGLNARTYGPPGLEEDIAFCARESVLAAVPRLAGMQGPAAEIVA